MARRYDPETAALLVMEAQLQVPRSILEYMARRGLPGVELAGPHARLDLLQAPGRSPSLSRPSALNRASRFPRGRGEFPTEVVEFVAKQVGADAEGLGGYDWSGRTIERHRAETRRFFGFREVTVADGNKLTDWLAGDVAQRERRPDLVREQFMAECRAQQLEPPTPGQIDRIVGAALTRAGEALATRIVARLDRAIALRLLTLVTVGDHDDSALLRSVKATTVDVSLKSMLAEIDKLEAVRSFRLPPTLFRDVVP